MMNSSQPTEEQQRQFREDGYFVMQRVIPDEHLELLRDECERYIDAIHAEMDQLGVNVMGINHRHSRYFIPNRFQESARLREFIFSSLMAGICRATLGDTACLFWEQYVVKCAEKGLPFAWHQDSGYVGFPHRPYVTCWCPLDDVNEENGTVYLLPYSRAGTRELVKHEKDQQLNDLVGYRGPDPGVPVNVPAGSIAVFSSTTFHRSGPNKTNHARRVYLPQYSVEPIKNKDGELKGFAEPFLRNGKVVANAAKP